MAAPGQIQITSVLYEVRWKLVLGIEGGAQGNCRTPFISPPTSSSLPNIYPLYSGLFPFLVIRTRDCIQGGKNKWRSKFASTIILFLYKNK